MPAICSASCIFSKAERRKPPTCSRRRSRSSLTWRSHDATTVSVLQELGRHEEALASYDKALALKPDFVDALNNRASALIELKRFEEALASYDRMLAIRPPYFEALYNRGIALGELGRHAEALASYDRALALHA